MKLEDYQMKTYKPIGNGCINNVFKKEQDLLKENTELQYKLNNKISKNNNYGGVSNLNENLNIMSEVNRRASEKKFGYFLTEAFYQAVPLDEDFKVENENTIKSYFITNLLENYGSITNLMEACKNNSSLLKSKVDEAKKCGKDLSEKCCKTIKEKKKDLSEYSINDFLNDNEEEFDYDKVDVNQISNAVKDKVIQVVIDEEERKEKNNEMIEEIKDAKNVSESTTVYSKHANEQYSLFKSIMMKNYKGTIYNLKENTVESSKYGTLSESGEINVNMDYIFCDTLLEYTYLELLNTMKIEKFTPSKVRQLSASYAYHNFSKDK